MPPKSTKMKNIIFLFLIAALMFGCVENQEKKYSTTNFDLIKISEGVYACIHKFGGKSVCNSGIVDNGESTIVFDSFLSPEAAEEVIEIVEQLELSPIKYVINSHSHNDHIRGNQSFSSDVKILSTKRTAELIEEEEPKSIASEKIYAKNQYEYFDSLSRAYKGDTTLREYQLIKMMKPYFEELSKSHERIKTRLPDTYVVNEKSINGSKRKVSLIAKGKGHTESDLFMYLPEEGILFAGDLVFNKFHPYLGNGYPEEWKSKLTEMESMKIQVVIPGHGDLGGKEMIKSTREYIEGMEGIAEEMKFKGNSIDDIKKVQMPGIYKDWWLENFFYANLEFMFNNNESK
jgi:glyoxylase-like metal-dependent hydrolase (beta-lactamase superfamily II)